MPVNCVCQGVPPHAVVMGVKGSLKGLPLWAGWLERSGWQKQPGQQSGLHCRGITALAEVPENVLVFVQDPMGSPAEKPARAPWGFVTAGCFGRMRAKCTQRQKGRERSCWVMSQKIHILSRQRDGRGEILQLGSTSPRNPQKKKTISKPLLGQRRLNQTGAAQVRPSLSCPFPSSPHCNSAVFGIYSKSGKGKKSVLSGEPTGPQQVLLWREVLAGKGRSFTLEIYGLHLKNVILIMDQRPQGD